MSSTEVLVVVSWAVLACVVLILAACKALLFVRSGREEFPPHLFNMPKTQAARITVSMHLEEVIEKWGKILTLVTVAYGLALVSVWKTQAQPSNVIEGHNIGGIGQRLHKSQSGFPVPASAPIDGST